MKKLLILLYLATFIESKLKSTDFCNRIEIEGNKKECYGKHNLSCNNIVCGKNQLYCQSFNYFSSVQNLPGFEKYFFYFKNKFNLFKRLIKDCPKPQEYKWNSKDVCLNTKDCENSNNMLATIWSKQTTSIECKCSGKYKQRCNSDYCASDKRACNGLKEVLQNAGISKCNETISITKYFKIRF